MFLYIIIFLFYLIALYVGKSYRNNSNKVILYYIIPIFLCFGYMTGSDWRMYELEFYDVSLKLSMKEPSYYLLAQIFNYCGIGFWEFTILYKLIGYYVFLHFFLKYSNNIIWGLIYWFPNYALFLWIDHPARNFIAYIIFLFALQYIEKKKPIQYVTIVLLASSFHATCLIMLPVYYIINVWKKERYTIWLVVVVAFYLVSDVLRVFLLQVFEMFGFMDRIAPYLQTDAYFDKQVSPLRFLIMLLPIFIATISIEKIRLRFQFADLMLKLSFICIIILCLGNIHYLFFRFHSFLMVPFCVLVSYICMSFDFKLYYKHSLRAFIILFSFVYMINLITRDSHYIPYSSYLEYIFQDKPSYHYRAQYNKIHSPYAYKDGENTL